MDCRQVNDMLDLLMDGALGDEEREAMEAHGRECPQCAAAIRATRQLKALFEQMEPEADVPLEAQAKWRGAVREASKRRKQKRLMRWIASAAAVISPEVEEAVRAEAAHSILILPETAEKFMVSA